jgi:ribosomal peptide maturation radical SAM protein 1
MPADAPQVALVYAPFGACRSPALGISLLKSALAREGIPCDIHYLNLALADQIGMRSYELIADGLRPPTLLGEWLFAPALFGEDARADTDYVERILWGEYRGTFSPEVVGELLRIRDSLPAFVDACTDRVDWSRYGWIGFSSSFHQHCASLALAQRIKARFPAVRIVFGGANCFGSMGAAVCRAFPFVDYACTGYGDVAFTALIQAVARGDDTACIPGIVSNRGRGLDREPIQVSPAVDLDQLPYPDYADYFAQLATSRRPADFDVWIPMESSRGCWWGETQQCTFCGFNTMELDYRCKSAERVVDELRYLCETYGDRITFSDNIIARPYFATVLPELARRPETSSLYWQVKATLTRDQVGLLAQAGVTCMQPGIESLSDPILRLMRKGTTLAHNLQILKWAKQLGIDVAWNVLWGFPGEDPAEYAAMERLVPRLVHLDPPTSWGHIRIDRFSAYWNAPAEYGITDLRPARAYRDVYHALSEEDLGDLAYHFDAAYADVSPLYAAGFERALRAWQDRTGAALDAFPTGDGIRIVDTRGGGDTRELLFEGLAAEVYLLCDAARTVRSLMAAPGVGARASEEEAVALLESFVDQGLMIRSGGRYLGLAVVREAGPEEPGER